MAENQWEPLQIICWVPTTSPPASCKKSQATSPVCTFPSRTWYMSLNQERKQVTTLVDTSATSLNKGHCLLSQASSGITFMDSNSSWEEKRAFAKLNFSIYLIH